MSNKLYEETSVATIADAIRSKNFSVNTYTVGDMATAISNIETGITVQTVTQDQYDALIEYATNCFYIIEKSTI